MKDLLTPPAERDMPPARARAMRASIIADISRPRRPVARRARVVLAVVATTAAAAAGMVTLSGQDDRQVLAFGPHEMSPPMRAAAQWCLERNDSHHRVPVTLADVAVAVERGEHFAFMFLTDKDYLACQLRDRPQLGWTGGTAVSTADRHWQRDWLPGPVDRLLLTSTEIDGGEVAVSGRVSARVDRLLLDHGDGRKTAARLANHTFGLVADGVHMKNNPELVSYDSAGNEIDRRPLFVPFDRLGRCYADPAGAIVYGEPGPACLTAEPWAR